MILLFVCVIWVGMGIIAFGIHNHYMRYKYYSLYIEDYYTFTQTNLVEDGLDVLIFIVSVLAGPCALIPSLILTDSPRKLCFKMKRWTQEEAAKLFPGAHTFQLDMQNGFKYDRSGIMRRDR